jgi:hypothetical protein
LRHSHGGLEGSRYKERELKLRIFTIASSWNIFIEEGPDGSLVFTPDVAGAKAGQPLGVNSGDNVTWNNRTNQEIKLKSIQPAEPPTVFPFNSIPAQAVSNPIFNVTETIGYSWVRPQVVAAKSHAARKGSSPGPARGATPEPASPDAWIVVV